MNIVRKSEMWYSTLIDIIGAALVAVATIDMYVRNQKVSTVVVVLK